MSSRGNNNGNLYCIFTALAVKMLTSEDWNQDDCNERKRLDVVFEELVDPRVDRTKKYPLNDMPKMTQH